MAFGELIDKLYSFTEFKLVLDEGSRAVMNVLRGFIASFIKFVPVVVSSSESSREDLVGKLNVGKIMRSGEVEIAIYPRSRDCSPSTGWNGRHSSSFMISQ